MSVKSSKAKALLIYPPNAGGRKGAKAIYYPLGIGYIAAVIRNDYDVRVHDLNLEYNLSPDLSWDRVHEVLTEEPYDVLLIGGVFPRYSFVKRLIEISRDVCNSKIVLGGSYLKPLLHVLPDFLKADYYVLGEGENNVLPLLDCILTSRPVEGVPGIAYRKEGKTISTPPPTTLLDLDAVPFPARDLSDFNVYKRCFAKSQPLVYSAHIIASRGCQFNCIFCNPAFGRRPNVRSPENIVAEMDALHRDYGCLYFHLHDEMLLGGKKSLVKEFCEYILKHRPGSYVWGGTTNHQLLDKEQLELMSRAGCIRLGFGVESGSVEILREMRKNHNLNKLKEILSYCNELGIEISFSLVTNSFSETPETLASTKEYLLSLTDNFFRIVPSVDFLVPIPGTDLYAQAQNRGLVDTDDLSNILALENESRYQLRVNLTQMKTSAFMSSLSELNEAVATSYKRKHPIQTAASALGNLDHFRLNDTIRYAAKGNLKSLFEGLLWSLSEGNLDTLPGQLYKRMVYS